MVETNIIYCYPVRQVDDENNWDTLNEKVDLGDGRVGIRQGREVIEVIVDDEEFGLHARYFDPLTSAELKKTKRGDGLWDAKEKIWRGVTSRGKHKPQRRKWED